MKSCHWNLGRLIIHVHVIACTCGVGRALPAAPLRSPVRSTYGPGGEFTVLVSNPHGIMTLAFKGATALDETTS